MPSLITVLLDPMSLTFTEGHKLPLERYLGEGDPFRFQATIEKVVTAPDAERQQMEVCEADGARWLLTLPAIRNVNPLVCTLAAR